MLGRVKDAVADAAETLRRAFAGLAVLEVAPEPFEAKGRGWMAPRAEARAGLDALEAACGRMPSLQERVDLRAVAPLLARVCAESGWTAWGAEAEVVRMEPLEAGRAKQVSVPPLPRKVPLRGGPPEPIRSQSWGWREPLPRPGFRRADPAFGGAAARSGLEAVLSLEIPLRGEDIQRLPKGLWMRYSLQLVRGTGENVRNLEVLGLFRIPRKGVAGLRHDPRRGMIFLRLEPEAVRRERVPFVLARRKDDGALVSCFVEDP